MPDRSHLDRKYFIDHAIYNCPFCNRRNVKYQFLRASIFHWTLSKPCYVYFVHCSDCKGASMHLSFEDIRASADVGDGTHKFDRFAEGIDIDSKLFYSSPTSFFVMDTRIPEIIRELITEGESSLKMNFLTGASACIRKAIYELTDIEKCEGDDYDSKINYLKTKYTGIDEDLFNILSHIKDMTSEKVHEQSWDKWDSGNLRLIIETLKAILAEIYVEPIIKKDRVESVRKLRTKLIENKRTKTEKDS